MKPLDPRLLRHARAARGYIALTAALGAAGAALVVTQAVLLAHALAGAVHDGAVLGIGALGGAAGTRTDDVPRVGTFVAWVVYAAYLHARTTRGWSGRKAAYFVFAGYACVVANFTVVNLAIEGLHSYAF